jgi:nicotinic acid mononucleotide adenylyltransferase
MSSQKRLKKIGLFGGTFDPVHFGHLRMAEECRAKLELDEIQLAAADMNCDATVDIMDVYQILLHYTERTELSPA